jgi:hypothetical protein
MTACGGFENQSLEEPMSSDPSTENPYASGANPYHSPEGSPQMGGDPRSKVAGPASGIMVAAVLGIILAVLGLLLNLLGIGVGAAGAMGALDDFDDAFSALGQGIFGVIQSVVGIMVGTVCAFGANKMRNLESYSLALASAILVMIPCVSPCCVIGLPVGIWALVVLNDPLVRSAFRG